ncbi:hypothetical protein ACLI4Z_03050 [Natrialbaceae archaeon A-arb3/5]
MALDEVLNGDQLTGRQAATIFFAWITVVFASGVVLLLITRATLG